MLWGGDAKQAPLQMWAQLVRKKGSPVASLKPSHAECLVYLMGPALLVSMTTSGSQELLVKRARLLGDPSQVT